MARATARRQESAAPPPWQPQSGFVERAPGVWLPADYVPSAWELPTPIVRNTEEGAAQYAKCVDSLAYFVFSFCWSLHTDDPSGDPSYRKIPAYPYLIDFFNRVQTPSNIHVEKSRQLLMSWAWMAVFLWDILFHENWANLALSRKADLVDDGSEGASSDSLLGKMLALWKGLPPYLQHPLTVKYMRVTCEATGSYVKGEASTTRAGRGAAYKRALLDEAAHIENSETLFRAVRQSAKSGLILNSTPMGKQGAFARIRFDKKVSFSKISYHWTVHPEKAKGLYCPCGFVADEADDRPPHEQFDDHVCLVTGEEIQRQPRSPWYDHETSDYTPAGIASEFELSYERSMQGRVYEPFDITKHTFDFQSLPDKTKKTDRELGTRRDFEQAMDWRRRYLRSIIDPELQVVCGWDFGVGDPTSILLGQIIDDQTMRIRWLDEFEHNNESWQFYAEFINGLWQPITREVTRRDIQHYGDPSGKGRESDLMSWVSNLATQKIVITHFPEIGQRLEWLDFIANLIRKDKFEVSLWCTNLIDALGQYHFPLDKDGNPIPGKLDPVHDKWSHAMDAMRYVYKYRYHARLKRVLEPKTEASKVLKIGRGVRFGSARAYEGRA